jgi:hypothetical protein
MVNLVKLINEGEKWVYAPVEIEWCQQWVYKMQFDMMIDRSLKDKVGM